MRVIEKTVFKFEELEESIQEKVIRDWRINDEYFWYHENADTLKAIENLFGIKVDYSYGDRDSFIKFSGLCIDEDISPVEFFLDIHSLDDWKDINENWKLTGYYMDSCFSPVIELLETGIGEIEDTIQDVLYEWLGYCQKDFEFWLSEESILEEIQIGEYEFYEDGNLY